MEQNIINLFLENRERTSKQIGNILNIPDWKVRRVLNRNNLYFGHYSPFGANSEITITDITEQIIIGSLLGDGHISKNKNKEKNSALHIKHSIKQRAYLRYKVFLLGKENITGKSTISYKIDKRNNKKYGYINFSSCNNTCFNKYRNNWYINGKKIIPKEVNITPISLAIWFMDDGTIAGKTGYYLCTNNFALEDVLTLQKKLLENLSLKVSIHYNNNKPILYIPKKQVSIFNSYIEPFIHKSMKYKILSA